MRSHSSNLKRENGSSKCSLQIEDTFATPLGALFDDVALQKICTLVLWRGSWRCSNMKNHNTHELMWLHISSNEIGAFLLYFTCRALNTQKFHLTQSYLIIRGREIVLMWIRIIKKSKSIYIHINFMQIQLLK